MATAMGGPAPRVLARTSLFAGWTAPALASVAALFRPRTVEPGDVICRWGEPGDEMFIVEYGRFAVEGVIGGHGVRFAELGPGAVFGEIAIVTHRPRSATVAAIDPGVLWVLSRADFARLAAQYPDVGMAASRIAAERLATNEHIGMANMGMPNLGLANEPQSVLVLQPRQDTITIGRDDRNDVIIPDPRVSRRHALLRRVGDGFQIEDLSSSNGVYVNGERVDHYKLRNGDEIRIGGRVFRFDQSELTHYARGRGIQVDGVDLTRVVGKGTTILSSVSLSVYPGELVAIVGGSGAGKTTLLGALSGVARPSSGRVLYNGQDYYRHFQAFRQGLGYVPQDDIVHAELSVYKTLYYAARLRLPSDTSRDEIEDRIEMVMDRLELAARRDTQVRRLSGGQRKRVSIGVELLTEPEVFYLDEPTSGLDPGLDLRMMELLRSLADQGRTVILTTHATRNVMLCDKVAFMARGGYLAYYGAPADALTHFGVQDFVDIYTRLDPEGAPQYWAERFQASEAYHRNVIQRLDAASRNHAEGNPDGQEGADHRRSLRRSGPGWFRQLYWLSARYLSVLQGDRVALAVLLGAAPILAMLMGSTFSKHPFARSFDDGGDVSQAIALLYVLTASTIFLGSFVAARCMAEEGPIYARERLVNLAIPPYVLSKVFGLGIFSVIQSAMLVAIVGYRLDVPGGRDTLLEWFGTLTMASFAAMSLGLFVSSMCSNTLRAMLVHSVAINPQLFLSGALVPLKQLDDNTRQIADTTIGRWAVSLLGYYTDLNGVFEAQVGPGNDYFDQFAIEPEQAFVAFGCIFVSFVILAMITLKIRSARR